MNLAIMPPLKFKFFYPLTGTPLAGGYVYTLLPGTTSIQTPPNPPLYPVATYQDQAGAALNTNPIILNASGEADIWLPTGYLKFAVYDPNGAFVTAVDNVSVPSQSSTQWVASGLTPIYVFAWQFTVAGDYTGTFTPRLRVRATLSGGYIYGTVMWSVYSLPYTTVNVQWDGTLLNNTVSAIDYGLISAFNSSQPQLSGPLGAVCVAPGGNYSITNSQLNGVFVASGGGACTLITPSVTMVMPGSWLWVVNRNTAVIAICPCSVSVASLGAITVAIGGMAQIVCDGTNWWGQKFG